MQTAIDVRHATKVFRFAKRQGLKGLFRPEYAEVTAVHDVSFKVERGESVAFIGPNGAGKSTTIKMLSGILQPTSGHVRVLGLDPLNQRRQLAYRIGTVFGQRSQLIFNLPLLDTLLLTADMYALDKAFAKQRIAEVVEQFDLGSFIGQPVRKLSLGQRMRAEVANSLLHNPDIIFLDEPTIGLDVVAKRSLREVIRQANKQLGATIFLTSHDVGDIEEVSNRTIIVNHGRIVLDTPTSKLKAHYLQSKTVRVVLANPQATVPKVLGLEPTVNANGVAEFAVNTEEHDLKHFLPALLKAVDIEDLTIQDTPLEDIIHELYVRQPHGRA